MFAFVEPDNSLKGEDDILDVASSRIAALAAMSSSEGKMILCFLATYPFCSLLSIKMHMPLFPCLCQ